MAVLTKEGLAYFWSKIKSSCLLSSQLLNRTYPVGSIYMSVNSTSPATLFGGSWTRIQDCFLYAAYGSGDYALGKTGGAKTVTLTAGQMPAHNHGGSSDSAGGHTPKGTISGGSHTHTASTDSKGAHTHSRGTMEITGSTTLCSTGTGSTASGAFSVSDSTVSGDDNNGKSKRTTLSFKASSNWSGATSSAGGHTHTMTVGNATPSMTFTGTAVGAHSHGISSSGEGKAHSNMPPFLAVYVWKRIE